LGGTAVMEDPRVAFYRLTLVADGTPPLLPSPLVFRLISNTQRFPLLSHQVRSTPPFTIFVMRSQASASCMVVLCVAAA
jgi:hypothetical protein